MQDKDKAATGKADNKDKPVTGNDMNHEERSAQSAYPNQANNNDGTGSTYGGTQSGDAAAPDSGQQPASGKGKLPEGMGDEYDSQTSYGDKGDNKAGDTAESDARGSGVI